MAKIKTVINEARGTLDISAPEMPALSVPLERKSNGEEVIVTVFGTEMNGVEQSQEANDWFTKYIGATTFMVRLPAHHDREAVPIYHPDARLAAGSEKTVSYADQFPYLVANTKTLAEVRRDTIGELGEENAITIRNFRPNIVIEGEDVKPWDELLFDKVHVGDAVTLHLTQSCTRCKLTTVVPEKGVFGGEQPLKHLRQNHDSTFGMHAVHSKQSRGKVIKVGDSFVVETTRTEAAVKK